MSFSLFYVCSIIPSSHGFYYAYFPFLKMRFEKKNEICWRLILLVYKKLLYLSVLFTVYKTKSDVNVFYHTFVGLCSPFFFLTIMIFEALLIYLYSYI